MVTKFKGLLAVALLLLLPVASSIKAGLRVNSVITINSGVPVQVWTHGSLIADELLIQGQIGSSAGIVYVMAGIAAGRTPATTNATDVTAVLCAATSTSPGCPYSDGKLTQQSTGVDVSTIWIDGAHTADKVIVSFNPR